VADEGDAVRDIAAIIGRRLGLPVEAVPSETYGPLGSIFAVDQPSSSVHTRQTLGWKPTHPSLLTSGTLVMSSELGKHLGGRLDVREGSRDLSCTGIVGVRLLRQRRRAPRARDARRVACTERQSPKARSRGLVRNHPVGVISNSWQSLLLVVDVRCCLLLLFADALRRHCPLHLGRLASRLLRKTVSSTIRRCGASPTWHAADRRQCSGKLT
jgi:hypothetical protein